jgi:hypothetical protein
MELSKDLNYILNVDSGILDLVYGVERTVENGKDVVRCGINNHTMSFICESEVSDTKSQFTFYTPEKNKVTLTIITSKEYRLYKGVLFSNNAPDLSNDDDIQEFIMEHRHL